MPGLWLNCLVRALISSGQFSHKGNWRRESSGCFHSWMPYRCIRVCQHGFGKFFKGQVWKNVHDVINSSERSDTLVFNCYLCHVRFLLTCYVCSTKIGENSDISKCFENFVSQALGVLTRVYAAELRKLFSYRDYTKEIT